jgi:hypothetical protein
MRDVTSRRVNGTRSRVVLWLVGALAAAAALCFIAAGALLAVTLYDAGSFCRTPTHANPRLICDDARNRDFTVAVLLVAGAIASATVIRWLRRRRVGKSGSAASVVVALVFVLLLWWWIEGFVFMRGGA